MVRHGWRCETPMALMYMIILYIQSANNQVYCGENILVSLHATRTCIALKLQPTSMLGDERTVTIAKTSI